MFQEKKFELDLNGKKLSIEVGKLAKQTNAACLVSYGDSVVLATAVMGKEPQTGIDFFPLTVEFREKMYAAGKIKGSRFVKREGRPTDWAVLVGRMIDRGIRPLFNQELRHEVQVVVTTLSYDADSPFEVPAIIAASAVLHLSDIPWHGPLVGARVGRVGGQLVFNPTSDQMVQADLNLVFSASREKVIMIDADGKEVSEADMFAAFKFGLKESEAVFDFMEMVRKEVGLPKQDEKALIEASLSGSEVPLAEKVKVFEEAKKFFAPQLNEYLFNQPVGAKRERKERAKKILNDFVEQLKKADKHAEIIVYVKDNFEKYLEAEVTRAILEKEIRVDGRKLNQIRPISSSVGILPRTHGTGLFSRGETQVLSVVTLGAPGDVQTLDEMTENDTKKRYMHFYNCPPYSFGEAGAFRGPGRREIGHGALAEKALMPVLPDQETFPYTILVVSEVMGSNGSSSMASTCGSTLALMDAGVPLKKPVAGIAMGLASDGKNYKILTDLQDLEDGEGGMDFKVTGTRDGITAIQMDTKTDGLTLAICEETMTRAKEARMTILAEIEKTIKEPRKELSPYAPRIITIRIPAEKIGEVIGSGGKIINEIIDTCNVQIDIDDDGLVMITGVGDESVAKAKKWIEQITKDIEVGEFYDGVVVNITDFGAFVEILPGRDGLVHISEIDDRRINHVSDVLKIGDKVRVKVIRVENGKVSLSIKQAKKAEK